VSTGRDKLFSIGTRIWVQCGFLTAGNSCSWKLVLALGIVLYAILVAVALASETNLSPYLTFLAALSVSIAVIWSLTLKASLEIKSMLEVPVELPQEFWLGGSRGKRQWAISLSVPLVITALDYFTPGRTTYYNVTAIIMLNTSAMLGFALPVYLYRQFRSVVQDMQNRIDSSDTKRRATTVIFALAAGGSPTYQAVTMLVAFLAYMIFALLAFVLQGFFFFRLLPILVSIIIAGIVAPMTTTISGFVVHCRRVFRGRSLDLMACDGQGGFGSIGTIGLASSTMSAIVAGLGVPVSFFGPSTVTYYEAGLTAFAVFFVALTFGVPVVFSHAIIASSKRASLEKLCSRYQMILGTSEMAGAGNPKNDQTGLLRMLYLESLIHRVLNVQEWPSSYVMIWGVMNAIIPLGVELVGKHFGIF